MWNLQCYNKTLRWMPIKLFKYFHYRLALNRPNTKELRNGRMRTGPRVTTQKTAPAPETLRRRPSEMFQTFHLLTR